MLVGERGQPLTGAQIVLYSAVIGVVASFVGLLASLLVPLGHPWGTWVTVTAVTAALASVILLGVRSKPRRRG
jgi:hypothetical protein